MVKDKPNSIRTYDEEGFRRRAACLCVRNELEDEILLVTSSGDRERWTVPGGGLEPDEDPKTAAIREVLEEAGVTGHLTRCLGSFEHLERNHRTLVYVLTVTQELEQWEDRESRQRKWFKLDDAIAELSTHKPIQCKYVRLLSKREKQPAVFPSGSLSSTSAHEHSKEDNPVTGTQAFPEETSTYNSYATKNTEEVIGGSKNR